MNPAPSSRFNGAVIAEMTIDDPLVTVKELLGHSSVSVTMRYAHTNHDAKERAVQLLDENSDKIVTIGQNKRMKA